MATRDTTLHFRVVRVESRDNWHSALCPTLPRICNEIWLCFILEITLVDLRFRIGSISLIFILFRLWLLKCFNSPFDNTLESGCPLWFFNKLLIGIRLLRLLDWQSIFIIELVLSRCYRVLFWANIVFSQYTFLIAFHFFFIFHFFVLGLKIR